MWEIIRGPERLPDGPDHQAWLFMLEREEEEVRRLEFQVAGAAAATSRASLPAQVREAIESDGLTEVAPILPWGEVPRKIVAGSAWITLYHRNEYCSRIGRNMPDHEDAPTSFLTRLETDKVTAVYSRGVKVIFEFNRDRWTKQSFYRGSPGQGPEPLLLGDVIAEVQAEGQLQKTLDIDPKGAANLPLRPLAAKA